MAKAADVVVQCPENEGVEYVFGIPGEENLDLLESLRKSKIKLVLTRHEQSAGFMAATYGRLTGKTGVSLSTLGPGATNPVTASAYAYGRYADDDDHRPKADQEVQAGPLPDHRCVRHDGPHHQVHPPVRLGRQHPGPHARSLPPG